MGSQPAHVMKGSRHRFRSLLSANGTPSSGSVCPSCRNHVLQSRQASTAAAAVTETATDHDAATKAPLPRQAYQVRTGVVLSRPPLITRDLTPFEKAFYLYQRRLNERLALPAMQYFYFRPNSPAMLEFKRKRRMRKGVAARDIGPYNPYDKESGWHDELLLGDEISEPEHQANELIKDSIPLPKDSESGEVEDVPQSSQEPVHALMPRITEADQKGDQRSLDRLLQRTLYLLVQNDKGKWTFPQDSVTGRESLALAAQRILVQTGGENMNTWVVGNHPVGHLVLDHSLQQDSKDKKDGEKQLAKPTQTLGEKVFFMKARIMAGQANLQQNAFGLKDFKWLVREEVEQQVSRSYWNSIKNMLPSR